MEPHVAARPEMHRISSVPSAGDSLCHRIPMKPDSMIRAIPAAVLSFLVAVPLAAQTYRIERSGGALGTTLDVELSGPNGSGYLLLPSLNAGPLPLAVLDATDTRTLEVGIDLPFFLLTGLFGPNKVRLPYAIPNDSSLRGQTLHFHGFLFPGATRLAGPLSNPIRATFGLTNAWTGRGKVLTNTTALATTNALTDGRVLIAGGGSGSLVSARGLDNTELYDGDRQRFVAGPKLLAARALHQAVTLANGKVLLIGGANATGVALASCEVFDPATNTVSSAASMSRARAGHTATLLKDGRVLVTGGSSSLADLASAILGITQSCEIYDPTKNSWTTVANMSIVRLGQTATLLANGKVLVCGGATVNFIFPAVTNTAEVYDPAGNSWSATGAMTYATFSHTLATLADGRLLAIGGGVISGLTNVIATNQTSVYDPGTGLWLAGGNLANARATASVALATDGRLLAIGGATGSLLAPSSLTSCEWFDPTTRAWSMGPSMGTSRAGSIALQRPEGLVFVAGGVGGASNVTLDTGEILYLQ